MHLDLFSQFLCLPIRIVLLWLLHCVYAPGPWFRDALHDSLDYFSLGILGDSYYLVMNT